ncbi:dTDP-4-dehydrorhamnose reductase [Anaerolineae bacterium]|nr:dTDP-4-dehydrorhamnose reductase [Anaerolineae bacterium]
MKRILVTGGSGDLGRVLCRRAGALGWEVAAAYLTHANRIIAGVPIQVDLTDRDALNEVIDQVRPDVVFHTAVPPITTPNLRQAILTAAYNLSRLCPKTTRLIFLSSDMVFDGTRPPYKDDDPPSPLSVYGQAKAEMEMIGDQVVRTSLIYDFQAGNKQVDWMLEKINRGETVKLYADEYRCPIWVETLAEALIELSESMFKGILNIASPEPMTRLELGWKILEAMGKDPEVHIEAISAATTGRPADLTLDVGKAQLLLKTKLLSVDEAAAQWRETHPQAPDKS